MVEVEVETPPLAVVGCSDRGGDDGDGADGDHVEGGDHRAFVGRGRGGARAGHPHVAARSDRSEPWGIWKIAQVVRSSGEVLGYGATCARHTNGYDQVVCKRQLLFGKRAPLSDGECRCRMKAWLLQGHAIVDGAGSRDAHMTIMPRDIALRSEADLDAEAAAIAAAAV